MTLYKAAEIAQQDRPLAERILRGEISVGAADAQIRKAAQAKTSNDSEVAVKKFMDSLKGAIEALKTSGVSDSPQAAKFLAQLQKVFDEANNFF